MRWCSIPISLSNLTLSNTLPVGQSFLWHRRQVEPGPSSSTAPDAPEEFSRAIDNPPRVVFLRQTPRHLHYSCAYPDDRGQAVDKDYELTRRWLHDYFQLDHDLDKLYADWRRLDPLLFGKIEINERAIGVRLLRQDPWECLVAFITSTNNHISRIGSLMHKLTRAYSPPLLTQYDQTYHLFPSPDSFPTNLETQLRDMGFGYRAGFLESSLATLRDKFGNQPGQIEAGLEQWRTKDVKFVRDQLLELKGVGRKVADCVMLMCLDQLALIPVDTHVAAIAARHPTFPGRLKGKTMSKQIYDETQAFLEEKWGPLGGWAQAVMFAADLKVTTTPKTTPIKKSPSSIIKTEPLYDLESPDSPSPPQGETPDASPLKRKSAPTEFKRTRSATRLSIQRTDSARLIEKVEDLQV